jgi:hypothetical protein
MLKTDYSGSGSGPSYDTAENGYQYKSMHKDFRMPRIDFPRFDGEHPRVWKDKCEKYFRMCVVPPDLWAPLATLHFHSHAAYWLQTFEAQHTNYTWVELCAAVEAKFGREMYHNYMRDLLAIKQTSDVTKYHARFVDAMHKVMLHHQGHDHVLFVQKFIDGLKPKISNAIMLHKPRTVDVAMSLAMEEKVLETSQRRYSPRPAKEYPRFNKYDRDGTKIATPADKGLGGTAVVLNECFKCGAKWGLGHKCAQNIPLHLMEEVLDILQEQQGQDHLTSDGSDSDTELLALSFCATAEGSGKKTIRLHGLVGKQEFLILIDSGSSSSFISQTVVTNMHIPTQATQPVQVSVANGAKMFSTELVENFTWLTQGQTFSTTLRVLPLQCYDIVLGMDWLETFSPVWIHWRRKILRFTHKGSMIQLHGIKPKTSSCFQISVKKLKGLMRKRRNSSAHASITSVGYKGG